MASGKPSTSRRSNESDTCQANKRWFADRGRGGGGGGGKEWSEAENISNISESALHHWVGGTEPTTQIRVCLAPLLHLVRQAWVCETNTSSEALFGLGHDLFVRRCLQMGAEFAEPELKDALEAVEIQVIRTPLGNPAGQESHCPPREVNKHRFVSLQHSGLHIA